MAAGLSWLFVAWALLTCPWHRRCQRLYGQVPKSYRGLLSTIQVVLIYTVDLAASSVPTSTMQMGLC